MLETGLSQGDRYRNEKFFWRQPDRELLNFNISSIEFKTFHNIFQSVLNKNASLKQKDLKANHAALSLKSYKILSRKGPMRGLLPET